MLPVRQVDSSTGILLFLFQAFLIDQGITMIPLRKIFALTEPFGKTESAIRMGLSRGVKNGLLVNEKQGGEVCYGLSPTTVNSSVEWRRTFERFGAHIPRQREPWNGIWTIAYSQGTKSGESLPPDHSFGLLSRNTWISPFELSQDDLMALEGKIQGITVFSSQRVAGLADKQVTEMVWATTGLANGYLNYLTELRESYAQVKQASNRERSGLLFLNRFGLRLFELIQEDPQLPLAVLPESWRGLDSFNEFGMYRAEIHPLVQSWVFDILNNGRDEKL